MSVYGVENCVKTIEQYLIIKGFIKADMIKAGGRNSYKKYITKNLQLVYELQIFLLYEMRVKRYFAPHL